MTDITCRRIGITGGIGSGKTVVSNILAAMDYPVYDCDSRAKALMESDQAMLKRIADEISSEVFNADNSLNRKLLGDIVFRDMDKLLCLNSIVHGAVREDLRLWFDNQSNEIAFVESAILYESEIDKMVDGVWLVTAPAHLRIERVINRNGLTREQVVQRMQTQNSDISAHSQCPVYPIVNDGHESLLLQIDRALADVRHKQ